MSIGILIISIIFSAIQIGLCYVGLAYEPIAELFVGWPAWAITGCLFGIGMVLSFLLIIIVGSLNISSHAADFVRDHFGRAIALMLISVIFVTGLSAGFELIYQIEPNEREEKEKYVEVYSDILYLIDTSSSMTWAMPDGVTKRETAMKEAFQRNLNEMKDGQYISIITYNAASRVRQDWVQLDSTERSKIAALINRESMTGSTDFTGAIRMANDQVKKSLSAGRSVEVIMISDGEDKIVDVASTAPDIYNNNIKIHTIMIGLSANGAHLKHISNETNGTFYGTSDTVSMLAATMKQITEKATKKIAADEGFTIKDTLITERNDERSLVLPGTLLRIVMLFIICFVFKLITNICIGNNGTSIGSHVLLSFIVALISALCVEFGYAAGLPMVVVTGVLWIMLMTQFVLTNR